MNADGFLDRILDRTRERVRALPRRAGARAGAGTPGRFRAALAGGGPPRVIAEVKRASPSRGEFAPDLDVAELARQYRAGGAAALSVLTEPEFFLGSAADLRKASEASGLPVLRKDFLIDPAQVDESASMGADAVLLIVAVLSGVALATMLDAARRRGLDALVEVHDAAELQLALDAGADLIGVNRRDLRTFRIDPDRAEALAASFPDGVVRVAESGVRTAADVRRLGAAGYHAVLVGEHLVTSGDPAAALGKLRR